ncbi:hypothetical protein [Silvanigrella aquatica]|uniref:Uncharacterized protein n=1 Tax=Silvanigrella aquatica TaxID=1915309 RepID=A0A1L4D3H7_9BACT|nr:hypothetical protein [Silvanigrella aquatica]APJ04741.1 hypothetical protein AXG55_12880 [Silvanigrella aquatica]
MVKNLFQLYSFVASTNENNSGAKIIQFSDHKHKSEHKKLKQPSVRGGHNDSLARNVKNQHTVKSHNPSSYKSFNKVKKSPKSKFSLASLLFYTFAIFGILFGLFILFGGLSLFFK